MRLTTTVALSAALATAACSTGPSAELRSAAQEEFKTCMGLGTPNGGVIKLAAPSLTEVTAQVDGLDSEVITPQKYPDFTIRGMLPEYEEKSKDGDKTITSTMNVGITFKSVGGVFSATLAGSKMNTDQDGKTRNYPLFSQQLDTKTADFKGVNVSTILTEGQGCALVAKQKLGMDM